MFSNIHKDLFLSVLTNIKSSLTKCLNTQRKKKIKVRWNWTKIFITFHFSFIVWKERYMCTHAHTIKSIMFNARNNNNNWRTYGDMRLKIWGAVSLGINRVEKERSPSFICTRQLFSFSEVRDIKLEDIAK